MSKIKICKNTLNYNELIEILKYNKIDFETKNCLHKCSKCHKKVLIKKKGKYMSGKTVESLINKLKVE